MHDDREYQRRAAALLRSAANDLKRNDAVAEEDLGLQAGEFADYAAGTRTIPWDLVERASQRWPINERDLLPIRDDLDRGIRVCRAAASEESSRIIQRGGVDYYEYRDTAMSRVASFRPEWIRMLCCVDDNDPRNPAVRWNSGHLLFQFTYFVGPVNYYYRWRGESFCAAMETGDSVWGVPFAEHSFTSRNGNEDAYILALTYGGLITGDAQREMSVLGEEACRKYQLPFEPSQAQGALIKTYAQARAMPSDVLAELCGIGEPRLAQLIDGHATAEISELRALAEALNVSLCDLLPPNTRTSDGVHFGRARSAKKWRYPSADNASYTISTLASDPSHPDTTALEVSVLPGAAQPEHLSTYQHQYLYVLDADDLTLTWDASGARYETTVRAQDSVYIAPFVPFALTTGGNRVAKVILLRIGSAITRDARFALSAMADGGLRRYVNETNLWYPTEKGTLHAV